MGFLRVPPSSFPGAYRPVFGVESTPRITDLDPRNAQCDVSRAALLDA